MPYMALEPILVYFGMLGLVSYFACTILNIIDKETDKMMGSSICQSQDEEQQREYVCICPCLGYKLKGSCRHLPR